MAMRRLRGVLAAFCILCTLAFDPSDGSPTLLLGTNKGVRLTSISRNNKEITIASDAIQGAVDFFWERQLVCWSDPLNKTIQCANVNDPASSRIVVVNSTFISPMSIACDWYTNKIYWTDEGQNRIEVASIDGKHDRKVLFWTDIVEPRAIALAPMKSLMFWTDWGESPKIERASMNGDPSTRLVIVSEDIFWPISMTIDYNNELIYWIDGKLKFIDVMDYNGKNRRTLIKDHLNNPYSLSYIDDRLYWTDWAKYEVYRINVTKNGLHKHSEALITGGEIAPGDIEIFDPKRQPYIYDNENNNSNPCKNNNGNCSHLCLLTTYLPGYTCSCPTGIKLVDNFTCAPRSDELLLIVQRTKIGKVSLQTPDYTNFILPLTDLKHAIAIDFDPIDEMLYWTDEHTRRIRRAFLNGTGQQDIIIDEVTNPDGIAIDWIARNLYWTDAGTNRIEISRLNGKNRRVIVSKDLGEPRAIALAPHFGLMFWSDWDKKRPKIERSNLDGSERKVLVTKDIAWPNGIALDYDRKKVYWCDAKMDKIEVCNMDGSDRRELITDELPHLFGLSLLDDYLYWTDWQQRSVNRAHKLNGDDRMTIVDQVSDIMGLKAVRLGNPVGSNPCQFNNGGCSHLCLNRPGNDSICSCQMGYELTKDRKTCIIPEAFILFSKKDTIGRLSIENENYDDSLPFSEVKDASALDFVISDGQIYWSDLKSKTISSGYINGSNVVKIVELGLESPEGLAIDWMSHNLYWSDIGTKRIELIQLKNKSRKVLIWKNLTEPRSLVVDPINGFIYWSEWGKSGCIERATLDGLSRKVILSHTGHTYGLTIDHNLHKLYWADSNTPSIESYDFKTLLRKTLVTKDIVYPMAITIHRDFIYWTDWNLGLIERANKTNGLNRTIVHNKLDSVTGITIYHKSKQNGTNPCSINNGNCTHICIALNHDANSSQTHKCICGTHHTLASDNKTCNPPQSYILYSLKNVMGRFLPDMNDCPDIALRVQGFKNVRSIAYDVMFHEIYWIDGRSKTIRKSIENNPNITVIVPGNVGYPYDLAIDPIGRLLFWSCAENDAINVTRLDDDNSAIGVIVKGDNVKPRLVAVHPEMRLLFWTDMGNMSITQSLMDGNERKIIAQSNDPITAITIDTIKNLVFWAHGRNIEYTEINGKKNNHRVLLSVETQDSVSHLAVLNDNLYWFSTANQLIERVNKTNGYNRKIMMQKRSLIDLITVVVPENDILQTHICSPFRHGNTNDGCSHICLSTDMTKHICSCPQYLVLDNKNGRVCQAAPVCGPDHFTCSDRSIASATGKDCIPQTWRCDGTPDCPDGSDELGCPSCDTTLRFQCANGQDCFDKSVVCDGIQQCQDGSDEARCCIPGEWHCKTVALCIHESLRCNGWANCFDASDEESCDAEKEEKHSIEFTPDNTKSPYIIIIMVILGIAICIFVVLHICRKSFSNNNELPDILHDSVRDPLSPKPGRSGKPMLLNKHNNNNNNHNTKDIKSGFKNMRMSSLSRTSFGSSSYDRSHITGASDSTKGSSTFVHYPQETLNPPPSPATTNASTLYSGSFENGNAPRYYPRRKYQQPYPTPCSTDVCDESDSNYPPVRERYEREPYPPPPTPIYHSDAGISCPPSPSSPRSSIYATYHPLPPPSQRPPSPPPQPPPSPIP